MKFVLLFLVVLSAFVFLSSAAVIQAKNQIDVSIDGSPVLSSGGAADRTYMMVTAPIRFGKRK